MSQVYEGYERQYCELSANLSRKCNSAAAFPDGDKTKQEVSELQAGLDDADVLIRKMDLEARSLQLSVKATLYAKLREYKSDLNKLKREVKKLTMPSSNHPAHEELVKSGLAGALENTEMGEADDSLKSKRIVFVTVGTTCFDSLVRAVDTAEVREALFKKGYTNLVIQMGRGSYIPTKSAGGDMSISVDYFTFSSSIADYLKSASLVISHAGSGSIFETLRLKKPLIVVVNEDLMDNHQSELAEELAERNHLFCARPQTLYTSISVMDLSSLVDYQPGDATPVANFINGFLGFTDD